jgi:hypothetical protein
MYSDRVILTIDGQRGCLEIICGFWQVALYLDKFGSICQGMLHDCKLNFIQIVSDHDLFLELPGRDPTERLVFLPVWSQYVNLPSIDKQVLS